MNQPKRLLALLLLAIMLFTFAGCGGETGDKTPSEQTSTEGTPQTTPDNSGSTGSAPGEKRLRVGITDLPSELSPFAGSNQARQFIMHSCYQVMLERNKGTGDLIKVMVSDIEMLDNLTYRFTFFDNIYDSAGNHFTANDAKFCINACIESGNVSGMKYIDSVDVVSDYVIEIKSNIESDYTVAKALSSVYMVTEASYTASEDGMLSDPVGTGPYELSDYVNGSHAVFTKKDDYWGKDLADESKCNGWYWHAANANEIEYVLVKESAQMSIALETGVIDIAQQPNSTEAERFMNRDGYTVWQFPDILTFCVYFNCSEASPLQNEALRKAICYAVDNSGCVAGIGYGYEANSFGAVTFADFQDKWKNEDYFGYDPEKAKQLLEESGFDTSKKLRFLCPNTESRVTTAQVVQSYLAAIGIDAEIMAYDNATFTAYKTDPSFWDIKLEVNAGECHTDLWTSRLGWDEKTMNYIFFYDEKLQNLIDGCNKISNATPENIDACSQYINEKAYAYATFTQENFNVSVDTVKDIGLNCKLYIMPGSCTLDDNFGK
jgi:ABC-type transport system substrate-binding protein